MTAPQRPSDPPLPVEPSWDDERLAAAFAARAARVVVPPDIFPVTLERLRPTTPTGPWRRRLLPAGAIAVLLIAIVGGGLAMLGGPGGLLGGGAGGVSFRDGPTPGLRTLDTGTFALDFPADWHGYDATGTFEGPSLAVLSSVAIPCRSGDAIDITCVYERPLVPGETRILIGIEPYRSGTVLDRPDIENGVTSRASLGGMPAIIDGFDLAPGVDFYAADGHTRWSIGTPTSLSRAVILDAQVREPGAADAWVQVGAVVESFRFTPSPTPLPEGSEAANTAARDMLDAEAGSFRQGFVPAGDPDGQTYLDCLSEAPGEDRVVGIDYGPGGDLGWTVLTRCRWTVIADESGPFWRIDTVYEWTVGEDFGRYRESYWIDAAGLVVARSSSGEVPPANGPDDAGVPPAASCESQPQDTAITCASVVRMGDQARADVDQLRIWLTTLGAVRSAMDPAQQTPLPADETRVWAMVFDGEWRCCPNAIDENGRPIPATTWTTWLVVAEADREGTGFVYLQDWSDRAVPEHLPAAVQPVPIPDQSAGPTPAWGPWPPQGAAVIELRNGAPGDIARVAVLDLSGELVEVRAPTTHDRGPGGASEVFSRDPTTSGHYRLRWGTLICDREMTVTIHPGVERIVIEHAPHGGCDAMGVGRELILEFSRDVDPTDVTLEVIPAELLPEALREPTTMTVDLVRGDTIDQIVVTDHTGSLMEARPAVLSEVPTDIQIAPGPRLARVEDGGTVVLWDGLRCDSDFSITIEADDPGPPERITVRNAEASACRLALVRRAVWLDLGPVNHDSIMVRHLNAAAPTDFR